MNEQNEALKDWDAYHVAHAVAKAGTVSGAAETLGVHHATVIRRIDALEASLGVRLFQRHARGYVLTEAGQDMLRTTQGVRDQLADLAGRIRGQGAAVTGRLTVTALAELSSLLVPVLARFQRENPEVRVELIADDRLLRLEYGEAHVAIRAGQAHETPDNVVRKLGRQAIGLYAHESYLARHGHPETTDDLANHSVIGFLDRDVRARFVTWLNDNVPDHAFKFRFSRHAGAEHAVAAGAGIGFLSNLKAAELPGVVEVFAPRDEWGADMWVLTHVDLHRTHKVQAFLKLLRQEAATWPWL